LDVRALGQKRMPCGKNVGKSQPLVNNTEQ